MSDNRLVWSGLTELRAELRRLPEALTAEATGIVDHAGTSAQSEIVAAYPARTGNLRSRVTLGRGVGLGRFTASTVLKNNAPLAWIFENGSQARHTTLGANRGAMPPGHVFIPIVIRKRREMYAQLKALLERHGLQVGGDG